MDDAALLSRITELVREEQTLIESSGHDAGRLRDLEVTLDQCWDLLRQRRARSEFGLNPDEASPRAEQTVEGYQQ